VVLEGSEDLTLGERSKEVHKVWDGVLIAFATEVSDHDLVAVLGQGTDDYMPITASGLEIVSRISVALRRAQATDVKHKSAQAGALYINIDIFQAFFGDQNLYLTPTGFKVLYHLLRNQGRVIHSSGVAGMYLGSEGEFYRGSLRKYIQRLPAKICAFGNSVNIISVPWLGNRLEATPDSSAISPKPLRLTS
jgi:DNA-binding response OmpR family regulator